MARSLRIALVWLAAGAAVAVTAPAGAFVQESCARAAVVALPGVTWRDVDRYEPPHITAAIEDGAWGSMSVRTNSARTSLASGFVTLGAGARVDGGVTTGGGEPVEEQSGGDSPALKAGGLGEIQRGVVEDGYSAVPGALAEALDAPVWAIGNGDLGRPVPPPVGYGRWALLAAMDASGVADRTAVSPELLVDDASAPYEVRTDPIGLNDEIGTFLKEPCGVAFIDQGDLTRFDQWMMALDRTEVTGDLAGAQRAALMASDGVVGELRSALAPDDLLLIVSPTSPSWAHEAHLGVGVVVGSGFEPGTTLESASTRRKSIVTLPDVAPTILEHFDIERPFVMNGREMISRPTEVADPALVMASLDEESTFIDEVKGPLSAIFVVFQVLVYVLILALFRWRERRGGVGVTAARWLQFCGLGVVAFPVVTYLVGVVDGHTLGALRFGLLLMLLDALLVAIVAVAFRRSLDRLLALVAFTWVVISVDLIMGSQLQLNTVFGYSPIIAGRFAGAGNIVFAVLGVAAILTAALIAYRFGGRRWTMPAVIVLFVATIVIDGAPAVGSDVGGVLALVPALGITLLLLTGRKPNLRMMLIAVVGGVAALAVFLVIDLSLPQESQTHLARLFEDTRARGFGVLFDTIQRKATANLRVFTTSIWTYFVPPALLAMAYLLRRPSGRWQRFAVGFPKLRAGLIGGLVLAALGFAVNDSGIVIPAVILSFLVPMALIVHLSMDAGWARPDRRTNPEADRSATPAESSELAEGPARGWRGRALRGES
ncbi:MAG: hypothetical protein ACRDKF_15965 [Actinomycetota bacterium]